MFTSTCSLLSFLLSSDCNLYPATSFLLSLSIMNEQHFVSAHNWFPVRNSQPRRGVREAEKEKATKKREKWANWWVLMLFFFSAFLFDSFSQASSSPSFQCFKRTSFLLILSTFLLTRLFRSSPPLSIIFHVSLTIYFHVFPLLFVLWE